MDRGGAPFPPALAAVASRAEAHVAALLDAQRAVWTPIDGRLSAPIDAVAALVAAGGKRIRPALCAVAYAGVGGEGGIAAPEVVAAGAALELLHTFALVHDDVMDGSETRRGVDAVHRAFVRRHEESEWHGESRRFGEGMAILVGDIAYVLADVLLRDAPPAVHALWDELRLELCIGQSLDLIGAAEATFELELAQRIVSYKSAKYTVERPLHLGAMLAGAGPSVVAALSRVGLPLGQAFQLRDDELGVFGDEVITGKPVGDDLREGKPTPMLAMAHERAARVPGAPRVLAMVGTRDLGEREIKEIQDVLIDTGALAAIEDEIERLVTEAVVAIDRAPLERGAAALLTDLAALHRVARPLVVAPHELARERNAAPAASGAGTARDDAAVVADRLEKRYGGTRAVDGMHFDVARGEIFALVGPNGAGKTTTVEMLEGYRRPDAGTVRVLGLDPIDDGRALRPRIGVMLQEGGLYPGLRPLEVLRLFAAFYENPEAPEALLDRVGLLEARRTVVRRLSGGQKQRLSLACALVGRPELVFLDEPTAGMDPHARATTWDLVRELPRPGHHDRGHHAPSRRGRATLRPGRDRRGRPGRRARHAARADAKRPGASRHVHRVRDARHARARPRARCRRHGRRVDRSGRRIRGAHAGHAGARRRAREPSVCDRRAPRFPAGQRAVARGGVPADHRGGRNAMSPSGREWRPVGRPIAHAVAAADERGWT